MKSISNDELFAKYTALTVEAESVAKTLLDRDVAWQHFAEYGLAYHAHVAYRKQYPGTTLREAIDAVRAFKKS